MPQIKFTANGSSSVYGNFGPGDLLRCSDAEARHFVEDAQCAKYVQPVDNPVQTEIAPARKTRAKHSKAE